jgi:Uma2 family endonuclease
MILRPHASKQINAFKNVRTSNALERPVLAIYITKSGSFEDCDATPPGVLEVLKSLRKNPAGVWEFRAFLSRNRRKHGHCFRPLPEIERLRVAGLLRYPRSVLMSVHITRKLFTVDDCMRMLDAGILHEDDRLELIRGELVQMSPIGPRHQAAIDRANRTFVRLAGDDAIVRPQGPAELDRYSAPQPDLALLRPKHDFYAKKHPGPADVLLIIEVADSSLEYDTTVKRDLYAMMGIREYWVVNLVDDRLLCHLSRRGDSYRTVREFRSGDTAAPQLLPGCRIKVDILLP